MVTRLFSQRSLFSVSRLVRPRNQTLRNISASGSQDRETQHLGAVLIPVSRREAGLEGWGVALLVLEVLVVVVGVLFPVSYSERLLLHTANLLQ